VLEHASGLGHALARKGIRVNTVSPGPIDFPGGAWDKLHEARPEFYEGSGLASRSAGWAARRRSRARSPSWPAGGSFCNAVNLVVDGGFVSASSTDMAGPAGRLDAVLVCGGRWHDFDYARYQAARAAR